MKQKIDRITTGAKSISLRTLAMVLCFVMLLTAIGVGTVVTAIAKSSNAKAAAAGALHIQLGGTHEYFGKPVLKPTIGDADRPAERKDIRLAVRLLYITAFLMMAVIAVIGLL